MDEDEWVCVDDHLIAMTRTCLDAVTRGPTTVGGRTANLLVARLTHAGDGQIWARYGWTRHPDLMTPAGDGLLADPAWVSAATAAADPTRD